MSELTECVKACALILGSNYTVNGEREKDRGIFIITITENVQSSARSMKK